MPQLFACCSIRFAHARLTSRFLLAVSSSKALPLALLCSLLCCGWLTPSPALAQTNPSSYAPGLEVSYYSNDSLSGTPAAQAIVPNVDFNWAGSPAAGIPADHWSAIFSGYVTAPSTGNYEFGTYTDDGSRLWVNSQLIIDDWTVHGATYRGSAPISLVQGQKVAIVYQMFDYDLGATAVVGMGPPGNVSTIPSSAWSHLETAPGLEASYYSDQYLATLVAKAIVPNVDFYWADSPAAGIPADHWSAIFSGYVTAPSTGNYEFGTYTDDGSRLWVNDQLVIDDWNVHGATYRGSAPIYLVQGQKVSIVYKMFDYDLGATAQVGMGAPGNVSPIPPSALSHLVSRDPIELRVRYYPRSNLPERMIGGIFQGSNTSVLWTDLATITSTPTSFYMDLPLGSSSFRYLRYVSPAGSYGNIAELEFYRGQTRLTGTGFGSPGSYNDDPAFTFDKALDGNINTYFDGADGNAVYTVGIDTGPYLGPLGMWAAGSGISSQGISYPTPGVGGNPSLGTTVPSNSSRRLVAYTAVDWDLWTPYGSGVASKVPDVCSYSWSASAGTFPNGAAGQTALWQAPIVSAPTSVTLTLTINDQGSANRGLFEAGVRSNSPQGAADLPVQFSIQVQVVPLTR